MKFKFNPLTWEFNLVPDSGTLKQKLNWLTGEFNLTKDAGKYKQIYNVIEWEFNLRPAVTQVIVHWVWSIQLTNAVENWLLSLKAYGWTEQRNLPSEYTQLEYITLNKSFFDTWITPTTDTDYELKFTIAQTNTTQWAMWMLNNSTPTNNFYFMVSSANKFLSALWTSAITLNDLPTAAADTDYLVKVNWETLTVNGSVASNFNRWTLEATQTIDLWCRKNSENNWLTWKLYYFKIWQWWTLVAHYIPCKRNSDNVLWYYDIVNGTFGVLLTQYWTPVAWNNATPTPAAPMDIVCNNGVLKPIHQSWLPIWYTLLDYIQSWWSNYIDTWIKITNEDVVEMQYLQTADKWAIYWEYYNGTANMSTTLYWNITFYFYAYNAWWTATNVWNYDANVHTVVHNFVDWYIDFDWVRTNFNLPSQNSFINTLNCPIFWRSNGSSIWYFSKTQLYYFRIRRSWTLILDLIPAKDSNNNVWMYDRVSWTLFTESWSWSFVAWNTVSDPMTVYADWITETIWISYLDTSITFTDWLYVWNNWVVYNNYNNWKATDYMAVAPGTYKLIFTNNHSDYYKRVAFYTSNTATSWDVIAAFDWRWLTWDQTIEFTVTQNWYVRMCLWKTDVFKSLEIPVWEATCETLLKIWDYTDEQEILSWDITRKIGVKVFDWTENVGTSNATFTVAVANRVSSKLPLVCSHFEYSTKTSSQVEDLKVISFSSTNIGFRYDACSDTTAFKTWLADQYNAWTPVIVLYPLNTPTTETVEWQTLSIPEWTSTIGIIEASLDNLELEAVYEQEA